MEMSKLLMGNHVEPALEFLYENRILGFTLPECAAMVGFDQTSEFHHKDVWEHTKMVVAQCPKELALRWTGLLHDIGKMWTRETTPEGKVHFFRHEDMGVLLLEGIADRFHFDNILRKRVRFLIKHHLRANLYDGSWTDSAVRRFMVDMGVYLEDLLKLARADITSGSPFRRERGRRLIDELEDRCAQIRDKDGQEPLLPKGFGNAVMKTFGLPPGPHIGELRKSVESAIIEGILQQNLPVEDYLDYVKTILQDQESNPASAEGVVNGNGNGSGLGNGGECSALKETNPVVKGTPTSSNNGKRKQNGQAETDVPRPKKRNGEETSIDHATKSTGTSKRRVIVRQIRRKVTSPNTGETGNEFK